MKAPANDQVQTILRRKRINDKVDQAVETGKRHKQPRFDIAVLDKVFRPFCHELDAERYGGGDSEEVLDATCAVVANMVVEFVCNVVPTGDAVQSREAFDTGDRMIGKVAEYLSRGLMINYGQDHLTAPDEHGKVGSQ